MSFLTIRKCHMEAIKGLTKIVIFLLKKCWLQVTALIALIVFVWGFYGGLLALLSGLIGALGVLYKITDWFLYHPEDPPDSRINVASPSVLRLPYESNFVQTADGVTINVVLIKQDSPEKFSSAPTIVYLHGNAGNIGHRLQNVSEMYHYLGVNVLLVEYRGYGLSKGSPSEWGLYLDAEAGLQFLLQHPAIDRSQIVLFGRSLGGAVALELAKSPKLGEHVAAVVIENTFTSIPDVARILFDCKLVRSVPFWFYKNQFNSIAKITQVGQPTLFLSGLQDELIPPTMMHNLYTTSASVMKHYHEFENGSHNFTWRCPDYYVIMNGFLNKVLGRTSMAMGIINQQQAIQLALQQQLVQGQLANSVPNSLNSVSIASNPVLAHNQVSAHSSAASSPVASRVVSGTGLTNSPLSTGHQGVSPTGSVNPVHQQFVNSAQNLDIIEII